MTFRVTTILPQNEHVSRTFRRLMQKCSKRYWKKQEM